MKYAIIFGVLILAAGCQNFSISNPNPYSVYNYDYSDCCYEGNKPRP